MKQKISIGEEKVALICEGNTEVTLMNILLDANYLLIERKQLLDKKPLGNYYMKGENFQNTYLTFQFEQPVTIILITDRPVKFKIHKLFKHKIKQIITVLTKPEIEILLVHHLGLVEAYNKQRKKPSVFLSQYLKISGAKQKSQAYIEENYDSEQVIEMIKIYMQKIKKEKNSYYLEDLLKD